MSSVYKVDINKIRQEGFEELLNVLEEVFEEVGIEQYFLIGATARDVWFSREDIPSRTTKDVDFAIYVGDRAQFYTVKEILVEREGFHEVHENAFALVNSRGSQIDILPFGEIEVYQGQIIGSQGLSSSKVNGFNEVSQAGTSAVDLGETRFQVATLSSIVLLKLISFDDRPENRWNDPKDIAQILKSFYDLEFDAVMDHHHDLLDETLAMGVPFVAARVIGRQMVKVLSENIILKDRITGILMNHVEHLEKSDLISIVARELGFDLEKAASLLTHLLQGINEGE